MDNSDNQGTRRDSRPREATALSLASMLIHAARRLAGIEPARRLDAGNGDRRLVAECVAEIAARYEADNSARGEDALRPIVTALREAKDISNITEVVQLLKDLRAPTEAELAGQS